MGGGKFESTLIVGSARKNQITNRLNALAEEPDAIKRNELKGELEKRINFIYYQAKDVADKIALIREALDG